MLLSGVQQQGHQDGGTAEVGDAVDVHRLIEKVGSDPAGADVRAGQGGDGPAEGREGEMEGRKRAGICVSANICNPRGGWEGRREGGREGGREDITYGKHQPLQ